VTLRILDSGPGITPSLSEQIGKSPVVSTKDQGLGVGLFLAFATINRLDGSIDMTPRQGGVGTRTQITLPVISHWS
jgi:two-component system sensor histidine kinase RegB